MNIFFLLIFCLGCGVQARILTTVGYQLGKNKPVVYALEGAVAIAGACVRWLRDNLGVIKTSEEVGKAHFRLKLN